MVRVGSYLERNTASCNKFAVLLVFALTMKVPLCWLFALLAKAVLATKVLRVPADSDFIQY